MKNLVEYNQSLKTQPGFNPNRDGPEFKTIPRCKTIIKR